MYLTGLLFNKIDKYEMQTDTLSQTFAALADPTRAILARLSDCEATVNELAAPFNITLPVISRYLKVLQGAGSTRA